LSRCFPNYGESFALVFAFDLREGLSLKDINPENKVVRMVLTYPELLDDSF
jgi:hypothetical protein